LVLAWFEVTVKDPSEWADVLLEQRLDDPER